jgi:hypothetical protein
VIERVVVVVEDDHTPGALSPGSRASHTRALDGLGSHHP